MTRRLEHAPGDSNRVGGWTLSNIDLDLPLTYRHPYQRCKFHFYHATEDFTRSCDADSVFLLSQQRQQPPGDAHSIVQPRPVRISATGALYPVDLE